MITTLNEFKIYLEQLVAPSTYKYSHPKLISYGILVDLLQQDYGLEENDHIIGKQDVTDTLIKHINPMQLDKYWQDQLMGLLSNNGWTLIGNSHSL